MLWVHEEMKKRLLMVFENQVDDIIKSIEGKNQEMLDAVVGLQVKTNVETDGVFAFVSIGNTAIEDFVSYPANAGGAIKTVLREAEKQLAVMSSVQDIREKLTKMFQGDIGSLEEDLSTTKN